MLHNVKSLHSNTLNAYIQVALSHELSQEYVNKMINDSYSLDFHLSTICLHSHHGKSLIPEEKSSGNIWDSPKRIFTNSIPSQASVEVQNRVITTIIITRSDQSSQTFAKNGAATYWTQKKSQFTPYFLMVDNCGWSRIHKRIQIVTKN